MADGSECVGVWSMVEVMVVVGRGSQVYRDFGVDGCGVGDGGGCWRL